MTEPSPQHVLALLDDLHGSVAVVGSINADLVVRTQRHPAPGETVQGCGLAIISGGKSANQAASAARLGAQVQILGAVGEDAFAPIVTQALAEAGVDVQHVLTRPDTATGTALITVDASAENTIVISPGANGTLTPADVAAHADLITNAGALGLVFEAPPATVLAAARIAHEAGVPVVLNPSPFRLPEPELLTCVDVLVVNEHELAQLDEHASEVSVPAVVVTLGAAGARVIEAGQPPHGIPAVPVTPVDTTGCGDAYTGTLLAGIAAGHNLTAVASLAAAVAGYAATKPGAQTSYPTPDQVRDLIAGMD